MTKRVLILNPDGTAEVGGVLCKLVPLCETDEMVDAAWGSDATDYVGEHHRIWSAGHAYRAMLSAADIDLSGLPRVPERKVLNASAADHYGQQRARIDGFNQALDAIGVKG